MQEVYSNSYCNISAADVDCSTKSLFSSRDPDLFFPQTIELEIVEEGETKGQSHFFLYDYKFWDFHIMSAAVNKRAWVLQERILSPRVLHFGRHQLLWECYEKDAAEAFPDGLPFPLTSQQHSGIKRLDTEVGQYSRLLKDQHPSASHLLWRSILQIYTACKLSVPSDKLIACSGIARYVANITGDKYIAGLWRRYLEGELLWCVEGNYRAGCSSRPHIYRAPTWSWASIDGPITPGLPRVQGSLITVEEVHLDYESMDTMAAVHSGWLRLRGVLKKLRLERKDIIPQVPAWNMFLHDANVSEPDGTSGTEPRIMLDVFQEKFDKENMESLLFCMPARMSKGDGQGMYLILFKLDNGREGTFRRIGIAYAWSERVKNQLLAKRPGEAELPCLEYCDSMHSIYVV